jgi:hypothetical protein
LLECCKNLDENGGTEVEKNLGRVDDEEVRDTEWILDCVKDLVTE